ncbi:MAG: hypothetical protein Q8J64_00670, partial [Thermodesulfovibrionales bacterium]|nr:hypothetical protein [Thermodesulfovibrionales bacterium]
GGAAFYFPFPPSLFIPYSLSSISSALRFHAFSSKGVLSWYFSESPTANLLSLLSVVNTAFGSLTGV